MKAVDMVNGASSKWELLHRCLDTFFLWMPRSCYTKHLFADVHTSGGPVQQPASATGQLNRGLWIRLAQQAL